MYGLRFCKMKGLLMEKLAKWFDNFWYHYKWTVFVGGFFVLFFLICTVQMATREKVDVYVLYTGPAVLSHQTIKDCESAFRQVMSDDYNGDGEKGIQFLDLTLMTDEQVAAAKQAAEEDGQGALVINAKTMSETKTRFNNEIFGGESVICLLDPAWYESVKAGGGFLPLSEALGYAPEGAIDEYGIYLHDTDFGSFFGCFDYLPEDTVLCFRRMTTVTMFKNQKEEQKRWEINKLMLQDLMSFTAPETEAPAETVEE